MNCLFILLAITGQCEPVYPCLPIYYCQEPIYMVPERPVYVPYITPKKPSVRAENKYAAVPNKEIKPKIVFSEEIVSTMYVSAAIVTKNYRIPVINGMLPNIRFGYSNGVLQSLEYHYDYPQVKKLPVKQTDSIAYIRSTNQPPTVTQLTEKDDGRGGRIEEVRYHHVVVVFVPDRIVNMLDLPDNKLRPPSEIEKK